MNKLVGSEEVSIRDWPRVLDILSSLKNPPRRMLLWGKPGTGKTTYALSLASNMETLSISEGQFSDALLGKFLLRDGSTWWADAAPVRAASQGLPLLLDELHEAGPELNSPLKAILNDPAVCRISLDNGTTVSPKDGYRVIATMNGSPAQLNEAVLDRFDVVLRCDTPHTGILRRLSPESAAFLMNLMENQPDGETWVPKISPRVMLAFEYLKREGVSDELAAELAFGEGQGKSVLMSIVDAARNAKAR